MPILRVAKVDNFTAIDNNIFMNKDLSLKAKGLVCQMLSLPDRWKFSVAGLASLAKDGKDSVMTALRELETAGYLTKESVREGGKFVEIIYTVHENPHTESPHPGNPHTESPTLLNTNKSNTNKSNTKNIDNSPIRAYKDVDKVIEEYNRICKSLPKCMRATKKRRDKIATRLKDYTLDDFIKAFEMSEQSDFLSGRRTEWRASLDWFIQNEDNLAKVLEGRYVETKTGNAEAEGHSSGDSEFYEDLPDVW